MMVNFEKFGPFLWLKLSYFIYPLAILYTLSSSNALENSIDDSPNIAPVIFMPVLSINSKFSTLVSLPWPPLLMNYL